VSGDGTEVAWTSAGDPTGANPDGGLELFSTVLATGETSQLTDGGAQELDVLGISATGDHVVSANHHAETGLGLTLTTTCAPAPRPDVQVATAASRRYVGDDVYAVQPLATQKRASPIAGGDSRSFLVLIENDRSTTDTFTVAGRDAGRPGYRVQYRYQGAGVSAAVRAGTFTVGPLDPGEHATLQVKVTAGAGVPRGARHRVDVTARSATNPVAADTVRARLTAT
jgi:hypothetical protein